MVWKTKELLLEVILTYFLDSILEAEGSSAALKKILFQNLLKLKKNTTYVIFAEIETERFTFREKYRSGFLQKRLDYFLFQIPYKNELKTLKFYLRYLLITLKFCFLCLVPNLHLKDKDYGNSIIRSS